MKQERLGYQFNTYNSVDKLPNNPDFWLDLVRFYKKVSCRGESDFSPPDFINGLKAILDSTGGKVVIAVDAEEKICGFIGGYVANIENIGMVPGEDVPQGSMYYMFGLGSSAKDLSVRTGLVEEILAEVETDYCLGLVCHKSPIYKRKIYPRRGWIEVEKSSFPDFSYFYIRREEVIK